jgi:hypothetical protein
MCQNSAVRAAGRRARQPLRDQREVIVLDETGVSSLASSSSIAAAKRLLTPDTPPSSRCGTAAARRRVAQRPQPFVGEAAVVAVVYCRRSSHSRRSWYERRAGGTATLSLASTTRRVGVAAAVRDPTRPGVPASARRVRSQPRQVACVTPMPPSASYE